jgi:heme-degrading monooxygenase HmoA
MMLLTVLEGEVEAARAKDLVAAFKQAESSIPAGFIRSELICAAGDGTRWRIETLWESREALVAMRNSGVPPAGVLMFRAAGAEPTLSIFDVRARIVAK